MKRLSSIRTSRKARVALALGAAVVSGVAIVGGAAAANAAPAPHTTDTAPAVVAVPEDTSLVEVPGAVPDLDSVEIGTATPVDAVPVPIGDGTTTARR
jgi:hypothetical protein